jgi:hypothetical protein
MKVYRKKTKWEFRPIYIKLETEQEAVEFRTIIGKTPFAQLLYDMYRGIGARLSK